MAESTSADTKATTEKTTASTTSTAPKTEGSTSTKSTGPESTTKSTSTESSTVTSSKAEGVVDNDQEQHEEDQRAAAKLLKAEADARNARTTALTTGREDHALAADEADAELEAVKASTSDEVAQYAHLSLLNPVSLTGQDRQVDTSGTAGISDSGGLVYAANVFGHPVHRAVMAMAPTSEPDPVTVVGAVPASNLVDPDSLEKAKSGLQEIEDSSKRKSS